MRYDEARDLLASVSAASAECLRAIGIPLRPVGKTRPWVRGRPVGIGFHYTASRDPVATARWFNQPSHGNTKSSVHWLVADRPDTRLTELWSRHEAASVFRVPTLLLASMDTGTWHMNWANGYVVGIENINQGPVASGVATVGDKPVRTYENGSFEPYTREQIVANALIGRMVRGLYGTLDPEWIVGHSQIWASKTDPGPAFISMREARELINQDLPLDGYYDDILWRFDPAPGGDSLPFDQPPEADDRGDPPEVQFHAEPIVGDLLGRDVLEVSRLIWRLGWPLAHDPSRVREFVSYFQRSTQAWVSSHPDRVLKIDGLAGPKTMAALKLRLQALGL